MQQIKIFKGIEGEFNQLETEVNTWIAKNKIRVQQIFGNISPQSASSRTGSQGLTKSEFAPSDVMLVVVYETG